MTKILKHGMSDADKHEADVKVQQVVAGILDDVRRGGDEAVREFSIKFDNWNPPSFKLSDEQIQEIILQVSTRINRAANQEVRAT